MRLLIVIITRKNIQSFKFDTLKEQRKPHLHRHSRLCILGAVPVQEGGVRVGKELALGVLVKYEDLACVLEGVVVPLLTWRVLDEPVQVVESHHSKIDGQLVLVQFVRLEGSRIHHCEWVVADFRGVDWFPDSEEDSELAVLIVHFPHEVMGLSFYSEQICIGVKL